MLRELRMDNDLDELIKSLMDFHFEVINIIIKVILKIVK